MSDTNPYESPQEAEAETRARIPLRLIFVLMASVLLTPVVVAAVGCASYQVARVVGVALTHGRPTTDPVIILLIVGVTMFPPMVAFCAMLYWIDRSISVIRSHVARQQFLIAAAAQEKDPSQS